MVKKNNPTLVKGLKTNYAAESTRRIKGDQRKCFVITRSKY